MRIGIGMGNPGVFQSYPHPNPSLSAPAQWGMGFDGYGCRVAVYPWIDNPSMGQLRVELQVDTQNMIYSSQELQNALIEPTVTLQVPQRVNEHEVPKLSQLQPH